MWTKGGARIGGRMRELFFDRRGKGGAVIIVGSEDGIICREVRVNSQRPKEV